MEDFLVGLQAALSNKNPQDRNYGKKVHFNSKIIVNHTSFISSHSSMSSSNFEDEYDKELEKIERETNLEEFIEHDRLFTSDPPSSLFDISGLTKSALSIQNDPSLSEMVTPLDPTAPSSPVPKSSPKPSSRLIKFDCQKVGGKNPNPKADPFLDQDKEIEKAFVIKSSFKPTFKSFLSAEIDLEEDVIEKASTLSEDEEDDDETIKSTDGIAHNMDKKSDECSWIGNENPLELYNQAHFDELGGSLVQDDFFELKREMDQNSFRLDEQFNNNILLPESGDDALSDISCSDFPQDGRKEEFSSILPAPSFEQQTPQTHTRTMQSISDELFSPGSFFASRSGQLGDLESKDQKSRPTWYTPKHDAQGRFIDPIGITPNRRPEKSFTEGSKDLVRYPLYVPTPAANRNIVPISINTYSSTGKEEQKEFVDDFKVEPAKEVIDSCDKETIDPFDWQNALEVTIPDTIIAEEEQHVNVSISSDTSIKRQKQHIKISFASSASNLTCCFNSALKESQSKILEFINDDPKPICWGFNLVGSCTLTNHDITVTVSDHIFRSDCTKGKLEGRTSKLFKIRFMPIQKGLYRALFHLKTNSRVISVWLEGKSGCCEPSKSAIIPKPDSKLSLEELIEFDLVKSPKTGPEFTPLQKAGQEAKTPTTLKVLSTQENTTPISFKSTPPSTGKRLHTPKLIRHKLDFGAVAVGERKTLYLRISNPNEKITKVSFAVTGEFVIPLKELEMSPRSYFVLPIFFQPFTASIVSIDELLIVKRENQTTTRLGLIGSVIVE